jgi:hypothetical protein
MNVGASRWRVILSGLSARSMDETVAYGEPFMESVAEAVACLYPDRQPGAGYLQDGPELFMAVNVSAPDAETAEHAGGEILTAGLPLWITVLSLEARPLLAEPDFTSPPSPA